MYFVAVFMVLKCQPEGDCTGRRCCVWLGWLLQDALCVSVVVGAEGLFQGGKRAASDLPGDGEDPPGGPPLCHRADGEAYTEAVF